MAKTIKTSEILLDDNLDALIAKLKQLEGVVESLTVAVGKEEKVAAELEATTKTLNATTANGREQLAKNAAAAEDVERAHKLYNKALAEETAKVQELKLATATLTNLKKNEAKAALAAEGSYNKLSAQYSIMKLALNAMSKAEREATDEGKQLVKTANATYQEMKRLQAETGKYTLNVGNYGEAVQMVDKNLGELKKELMALRNVSFVGKSEQEIAHLNQLIGKTVDEMEDLRAIQKAQGTEMSTLYVGSLKVVAAGVEGLVGTLSLLGVQSETLQVMEKKMLQLVAVTHALSEIEDALQKRTIQTTIARTQAAILTARDTVLKWSNNVATIAAARAEDARAIATTRGSIATRAAAAVQWLWNAALAANPIGLVVVAVAALAAGIIYLTYAMSDNTDEIERQNEALSKMSKERLLNEKLTEIKINNAREEGKSTLELTKLELEAAKNRRTALFNEHQQYLKIFNSKKLVSNEEIEKNKEYYTERQKTSEDIALLERREVRLSKEAADERAKQAKSNAERAKKERERLQKDSEAKLKEQQDAALKELETENAFQLAKFDIQTDYGNQSAEYQRQRAGERFLLEQELNKALLAEQLRFGRISTKEYETALLQQEVALKEFSARISQERNADAPTALPGIDLSKKNEAKAKKRVGDIMQGLTNTANAALKDGTISIYDLLGIKVDDRDEVKSSFDFAKQQLTDFMAFRTQIAAQNVASAEREVQATRFALEQAMEDRRAGLANLVETRQKEYDDARKQQEKALKEQERAAKAERAIQTAQTAVNLTLAIAKLFAEKNVLAIPLAALMIGSFAGFKLAAYAASRREYAEGGWGEIGGGTHASGNDTNLGFRTKDGKQAFAQKDELFGIVRHERAKRYKGEFGRIVDQMNAGTYKMEFDRQASTANGFPLVLNVGGSNVSTTGIERGLGKLIEQGRDKVLVDGKGRPKTVVRGNLTTVFRYSD